MMNRKPMAYALASVGAISLLSLGGFASAGYEFSCEVTPLATFQRTVSFAGGDVASKTIENLKWNADSSLWELGEDGNIAPAGADEEVNGVEKYLSQFGKVSEEDEGEGAYSYALDGQKIVSVGGMVQYIYHPTLKKLYTIKELSAAQEETLSSQTVVHKAQAGLVECGVKKDGKALGVAPTVAPKVETPKNEAPKVEVPEIKTDLSPVVAPTPVSASVSNLAIMTYETDKKGYLAIKNQPLFVVVKNFGFDFKQDRKALAEHFSIKNYTGSYAQNMQIKNELLKLIVVK